MIALVVLGWRRLPLSYSLYAAALLATFLLFPLAFRDTLEANQRFALEVFPAFMTLGLLARRPATQQAIVILFTGLLALLSLVFITGRWLVWNWQGLLAIETAPISKAIVALRNGA